MSKLVAGMVGLTLAAAMPVGARATVLGPDATACEGNGPAMLVRVEGLKKRGVIDKGMRPKVQSAVRALQDGVQRVHLIDGRMPHSLLLEIFTDKGVGTEIVHG